MSRSYSAHAIHGCKTTRSVSVGIAAALLLFVGVGAAADPSLQRFVSSEGRFSVLMPGTPTSQIVPVPSGPGKTTNLFEFSLSLENGDVRYLVTYYDYPPGMNPGTPEATLEAYRDGITIGKTLLSDKATVLNGVTGRAFTAPLRRPGVLHRRPPLRVDRLHEGGSSSERSQRLHELIRDPYTTVKLRFASQLRLNSFPKSCVTGTGPTSRLGVV